jgi:hypothetical protein
VTLLNKSAAAVDVNHAQYALPGTAGTFIDVTTDEDLHDMVRNST